MPDREGYLLAIDVGSTTTRCILFDLKGCATSEARREPPVYHPQVNWTEVEPEDWWTCTATVVREVLERARIPRKSVLAVGLCGLKHAVVPIDADGAPLARAMLWMDQRCQPQAEWMSREHGDLIAHAIGGNGTIGTTPSAPKLRWIVENEPDLLRRTAKFLLVKDFIRFRLTGTIGTDPSDAGGTSLYDQRSGTWSQRMLEMVGIPRKKMPPIYDAISVVGGITEKAGQATGLIPGTPVVVGGGDVQCTLLGAGASNARAESALGRGCLYLGTAAWMSVACARPAHKFFQADCFGATATTGASLKWLLDTVSPSACYGDLVRAADGVPLGARGLIFLPHLMGERAPTYDSEAKGVLFGLTLAHGRDDISRAVLEGCAFQLRYIAERLDPTDLEEMVVAGGGAKGTPWVRIICDVLGIPLLVPQVLEAGALGAAILAGVGVGVYPDVASAAQELVQIVGRIEPDWAHHEHYERIYAVFRDLERRVAPLYKSVPVRRPAELDATR